MRKKITKLFWIWNYDKEEKWLNEKAAEGLALVGVNCFTYEFEVGEPDEYAIRLELMDNWPTTSEVKEYIAFVEETGAEYVGSVFRWIYFRKKKELGSFALFSDIDSRLKFLRRIMILLGAVMVPNLLSFIINFSQYLNDGYYRAQLYMAILSGGIVALGLFGFYRIGKKYRALKKERNLHE